MSPLEPDSVDRRNVDSLSKNDEHVSTTLEGSASQDDDEIDNGSERATDSLPNGTPVALCLWAVELFLPHPITREPLHLKLIPEPDIFQYIRSHAAG